MTRHKDAMTATCRYFEARIDYHGGYWIDCAAGAKLFGDPGERDGYYRKKCCRCGRGCDLMRAKAKITRQE